MVVDSLVALDDTTLEPYSLVVELSVVVVDDDSTLDTSPEYDVDVESLVVADDTTSLL